MSGASVLWRVVRLDNNAYETVVSDTEPLTAPSDGGVIITNLTAIIMPEYTLIVDDGYVVIESKLADNQAIKINASSVFGGIDIDAGSGGITLDTTNAISLDAGAAINITTTLGNIDLDTVGLINLNGQSGINIGNDADAAPINLGTGAAAKTITLGNTTGSTMIDVNTGTGGFLVDTASGGPVSLDATGASSNFTLTGTADAQDLTIAILGGYNASLALTSTGTAADAVILSAVNAGGGIDIDASTGGIRADSTGQIYLASTKTVGGDITLDAQLGGLNLVGGVQGIAINSGTGLIGIGHWSAGNMDIGTSATARTITLGNATGATMVDVNTGTGGFLVDTTAGGTISLDATGASSNFTLTGTADAQDLTIAVTGGYNASLALTSTGTAADAVIISAVNAGGGIDIDASTGGIRADSTGQIYLASSKTVGGDVTLDAQLGGLNLVGGVQGIAINSGTGLIGIGHWSAGNMDIGTSATARTITIGNQTGATQLALQAGTGGIDLVSAGITLDSILNAVDAVLITASHVNGGIDINSGTGGTVCDSTGTIAINGQTGLNLGDGNDNANISIGTAGTRVINIGNTTSTTAVNISSGTWGITIGNNANGGEIHIGNVANSKNIIVGNNNTSSRLINRWGTSSLVQTQIAETAMANSDATLNMTNIRSRVITMTPTANRTLTMPTAADVVADYSGYQVSDALDFSIINNSSAVNSAVVTLAMGTGGTAIGNMDVRAVSNLLSTDFTSGSGMFRLRITNITASSEAYTVYRIA